MPADRIARLLAVVEDLTEAGNRATADTLVLDAAQAADVLDLEDIITTRWRDGTAIAAQINRFRAVADIPDVPVPASFTASLRPYQPAALLTGSFMMGGGLTNACAAPGDTPAYTGRVYRIHTPAAGDCPSLDWHVVVGKDNKLTDLVASEDMKSVFRVVGSFTPGQGFHLVGKELGGTRAGAVDGKVRPDGVLAATMTSMSRGSACNGKVVYVPWVSPKDAGGVGAEGSGG